MVVAKYLIDTNIFLEILLLQDKQNDCRKFIEDHFNEIALTQFTLNSIGISCYRNKRPDIFTSFLNDIVSFIHVLTLDISHLVLLEQAIEKEKLDYDDSYQLITAQIHKLELVTLDHDFNKVKNLINIHFL